MNQISDKQHSPEFANSLSRRGVDLGTKMRHDCLAFPFIFLMSLSNLRDLQLNVSSKLRNRFLLGHFHLGYSIVINSTAKLSCVRWDRLVLKCVQSVMA